MVEDSEIAFNGGTPDAGGSTGAPSSNTNVGIGADPEKDENEPTVVANPHDRNLLVAGSHSADATTLSCVAYFSRDKGSTWSAPSPVSAVGSRQARRPVSSPFELEPGTARR